MFKRGFKSFCENLSSHYRKQLKIDLYGPINVHDLAKHLNIKLLTPADIKSLTEGSIETLVNSHSKGWSAVTLSRDNQHIIIYNLAHVPVRQSNDIMHEMSHIILNHKPQTMHSYETGLLLRHYDDIQEKEADWLAATILLPKDALFEIKKTNLSDRASSNIYGVSAQLLKMRLNTSGVNRILENTRKKYY